MNIKDKLKYIEKFFPKYIYLDKTFIDNKIFFNDVRKSYKHRNILKLELSVWYSIEFKIIKISYVIINSKYFKNVFVTDSNSDVYDIVSNAKKGFSKEFTDYNEYLKFNRKQKIKKIKEL